MRDLPAAIPKRMLGPFGILPAREWTCSLPSLLPKILGFIVRKINNYYWILFNLNFQMNELAR
jgi:hypothetical protein